MPVHLLILLQNSLKHSLFLFFIVFLTMAQLFLYSIKDALEPSDIYFLSFAFLSFITVLHSAFHHFIEFFLFLLLLPILLTFFRRQFSFLPDDVHCFYHTLYKILICQFPILTRISFLNIRK